MMVAYPIIVGWAGQLLGVGRFDLPDCVLSIYCRLPMGDTTEQPLVCHCDVGPDSLTTPFETLLKPGISAVGLIVPIPPWGSIHRLAGHA